MTKVIVDTNVLIDALDDENSYTWKILELSSKGQVSFYASHKIVKEYQLIIDRQVKNEVDEKQLLDFISRVNIVKITHRVKVIKDDPEDDKFINTALSADVEYIVSSDRHLLALDQYEEIKIIDPKEFYLTYKGQKDDTGKDEWANLFSNIIK